ncbi:MAG: sigma-70 family RNA polymerase sigma factor [Acidobacteriota bacterium]|nr:sigma-70 family RNA polymerase sigma factor [Acidobacteriota bacterium]
MSHDVTNLLIQLSEGNRTVVNEIFGLIYNELKGIAGNYLRDERAGHTLQPTALVHEAYLKLIDQRSVTWQNRAHFFGVAAQVMRRILVDYARARNAEKRFGKLDKLQLDENIDKAVEMSAELVALDDALKNLAEVDEELAKLVELRYFGGLTFEETAEVMGLSLSTVKRHWKLARAWLYGQLSKT